MFLRGGFGVKVLIEEIGKLAQLHRRNQYNWRKLLTFVPGVGTSILHGSPGLRSTSNQATQLSPYNQTPLTDIELTNAVQRETYPARTEEAVTGTICLPHNQAKKTAKGKLASIRALIMYVG